MLRILVLLPFYGGSLPIGRYCAAALEDLGCLVETFESPDFFSAFSALKGLKVTSDRLEFLENNYLQMLSQAIFAKVDTFQPDLVLCMAQAPMSRQTLRRLRKMGVPTVMWFVEDYRVFPYWRAFAPHYDVFAVIQKEPFLEELAALGVSNALYLPLAALPDLHAPKALAPAEQQRFGGRVSFLGAGYPNRRNAFVQLVRQGVPLKIWGTEWEDEPRLAPQVQENGRRVSPEEAVCIYNATKVNINLHSGVDGRELVNHGDFVNPRTFELAACGAFQLVDTRGLMGELFAEDELARFDSLEELQDKIFWFLDRPEEREAYVRRGRERVLREHTYAQRMQTLLDFIRQRLSGFGSGRPQPAWPENMPAAMRAALSALLEELALPADAPFSDVVTAVRGREGRLSSLETALLFLDEWKKLYFH